MKKQITFLAAALLLSFLSHAQEISTTVGKAPTAPPKWKATASTYFYDFKGTKASESVNAPYSFDNSTLNMQLFTLSYEYSPKWTFQVMTQYLNNYVETIIPGLSPIKDRSIGLGDTFVSAISPFYASPAVVLVGDIGFSAPTGDINQTTALGGGHNAYNMQNGSGTFDTVTGLTALSFQGPVQLGSHLTGIFRNGRNINSYRLGNLYRADAWVDYNTKWGVSPRLVGYYKHKEAIDGEDVHYLKRSAYSEFYYHKQINWDISAALKYAHAVGPVTVAAEAGVPLAQNSSNYDNVVVSTEYYGNLSVAGSF